jgi:hypothetical protein
MDIAKIELPDQIFTEQDVYDFFYYLLHVENLSFHPDDSFSGCVDFRTGEPAFDEATCRKYDSLMDQCRKICGNRIYEIGLNVCHP